jgi:hypothetical protein
MATLRVQALAVAAGTADGYRAGPSSCSASVPEASPITSTEYGPSPLVKSSALSAESQFAARGQTGGRGGALHHKA